jgi:putative ABC transport system ATP-binding protein
MNEPLDYILSGQQITKQVSALDGSAHKVLDILTGADIEIKPGESVAILGASGSGKSTLLALLAGLDTASSGNIYLAGTHLNDLDEDGRAELRAEHVGFVFQSFQLLPSLNALENVMLPLELKSDPQARDKSMHMLQRVGLGERLNHYPRQLSGGEQQRVAIARAFVTRPSLLFADEPTGNLDANTGRHIIELLLELNREQKTTLVLVTHDNNLSRQCQRRLYLENGKLEEQ